MRPLLPVLRARWCSAALWLGAVLPAPAAAGVSGMIARLSADETLTAPVELRMVDPAGETTTLSLADDGVSPDVTPGDGSWAGLANKAPQQARVQLVFGGRTYDGGLVEWTSAESPRDLELILTGGRLAATARVQAGAQLAVASAPPADKDGVAPIGPDPSAPHRPNTDVPDAPSDGNLERVLWLGLGVLLGILGTRGLRSWGEARRTRPSRRSHAAGASPGHPLRQREAGLLGPGTPAVSDGLSVWSCGEPEAALEALLATLADGRQVVAVAPATLPLPPVVGGPVYRARTARPPAIADAVRRLQASSGAPIGVLLLTPTATAEHLDDIQDVLPNGVGGIVLTSTPGPLGNRPRVTLAQTPTGWTATPAGQPPIALQHTARGLAPA